MTNAFAVAMDTLFADPNLGSDAIYTPQGGAGTAIRAVITRGTVESFDIGRAGVRLAAADQAKAIFADVRRSEVPEPKKGDSLAVGSDDYVVTGAPILDDKQLTWRLTLGLPA